MQAQVPLRNRARTHWMVGATVSAAHLATAAALSRSVGALYEDGGHFHVLAAGLASDLDYGPPNFEAARPPGWPMLLAIPYRIFGPHPNVGLVLTAVLAGLTAVALIHLGQRLGMSPRQATLAGLAYGLFPWVLIIGASLYAESLFNLLTVVLCYLVVELRERRHATWWWLAAGVLAGYATLVRPVMAFWLPALVVFAIGRRLDWRAATAVVVGLAIVLGAWSWRNYERLDAFVPLTTAGGVTIALANNDLADSGQANEGLPIPPVDEVENDRYLRDFAVAWIRDHPAEFAKRAPERLVRTFDPVTRLNRGVFGDPAQRWSARVAWMAALVLIAVGLIRRHRGPWLVPLSLVVLLTVQVMVFGGGFRFLVPALPFLALWAIVGAAWLKDTLWPRPVEQPKDLAKEPVS
jgi:4-amino-4-deoxy-L-arabinose transferase-like glycosyltransferase